MSVVSRPRPLLLAALAIAPALVACTDEPELAPAPERPSFATATAAQRERALRLALGEDAALAQAFVRNVPLAPAGGCPRVELRAYGERVFHGGCTLPDGRRLEGTAWVRNVAVPGDLDGLRGVDPGYPWVIGFDRFAIGSGDDQLVIDGDLEGRALGPSNSSLAYASLAFERDGMYGELFGPLDCIDARCMPAAGMTVGVEGLPAVNLRVAASPARDPERIVLGADELTVTFAGGRCGRVQAAGQDMGELCRSTPPVFRFE